VPVTPWSHRVTNSGRIGAANDLVYVDQAVEIVGLWGEAPVSSAEEHLLDMEGVAGSIPAPPTSPSLAKRSEGRHAVAKRRWAAIVARELRLGEPT
jgi:hypothetical protein